MKQIKKIFKFFFIIVLIFSAMYGWIFALDSQLQKMDRYEIEHDCKYHSNSLCE